MERRNNTVYGQCRFCLMKGYHGDIMKEYFTNGTREVYIDIFMECFNIYASIYFVVNCISNLNILIY